MSGFLDAVTAVADYIAAYYPGDLPVYKQASDQPDAEDVASGWIGLQFDFGAQGPVGGRFGEASMYYNSPFIFTAQIMVPRSLGDGAALQAADDLCGILREKKLGDVQIRTLRPFVVPLEDGDTHVQIDLIVVCELEHFAPTDGAREPVTAALSDRITFDTPHGLSRGDVVYRSSTALPKAIATAETTLGRGMVAAVVSAYTVVVVWRGQVRLPAHGYTVGASMFLSTSTAGGITATEPGLGTWRQRIGSAWSADEFTFDPEPGALL